MSLVGRDEPARDAPAGQDLVDAVRAFEMILRDAIAAGSRVTSATLEAQRAAGLHPTVGHQILSAMGNASQSVIAALKHSADGHRLMEALAQRSGIDPAAYGDVNKDARTFFTRAAGSGHDHVG